jgi:hypothetical protein
VWVRRAVSAAMPRPRRGGAAAVAAASVALVAAVLLAGLVGRADAHLSAVCSATHEQRPQTVTFLYGTYHTAPSAGYSVPGTGYIKTPQGHTFDFPFDSFCAIPVVGSNTGWKLEETVASYRARIMSNCVCSKILECGSYNSVTGKCTGTTGDCATINPKLTEIECYGQDYNVPESEGAWGKQLADNAPGNCAYGSVTGVDFATWMRAFYIAKVDSIYSGIFEVWSKDTDVNLDPSTTYLRDTGQHPCTLSKNLHVFLPVTVADGGVPCTDPPTVDTDAECVPRTNNNIISGYVCASACPDDEVSVSVYQCKDGEWDETSKCLDAKDTMTCSAADSAGVGPGVIGIDGEGCDQLSAVGTTCDIVCADGYWGYGQITCADSTRRRLPEAEQTEQREREASARRLERKLERNNYRANDSQPRSLLAGRMDGSSDANAAADADGVAGNDALALDGEEEGERHLRRRLAWYQAADCTGKVQWYDTAWLGNGKCDTLQMGSTIDLACTTYNYDGGDCSEAVYGRDCNGKLYKAGTVDPYK